MPQIHDFIYVEQPVEPNKQSGAPMPQIFDIVYDPDGNCCLFYCSRPGVVLATEQASPETGLWFCAEHWNEQERSVLNVLTVVEEKQLDPAH